MLKIRIKNKDNMLDRNRGERSSMGCHTSNLGRPKISYIKKTKRYAVFQKTHQSNSFFFLKNPSTRKDIIGLVS